MRELLELIHCVGTLVTYQPRRLVLPWLAELLAWLPSSLEAVWTEVL